MHVFATQIAYTALANVRYLLEQRLARWILIVPRSPSSHRRDGDNARLYRADVVARAPGVTTSLHVLEGHHLIRSLGGSIMVRNRAGLEELRLGSYGVSSMNTSD